MFDEVLCVDCIDGMAELPDACVDLTLTSPPYDGLRHFGLVPLLFDEIGKELFRVTKDGGVLVWVVADHVRNSEESGSSFHQALAFKELGFCLHQTLVMESVDFRFIHQLRYPGYLQYAFVLSKGRPKCVNVIRDMPRSSGTPKGSWVTDPDGTKRKIRTKKVQPTPFVRRGRVWRYGGRSTKDQYALDHPAVMPEKMARDFIVSYSQPGDLVFDPMCGSGTTCKMAAMTGRHYLGMEVCEPYYDIACRRVAEAMGQPCGTADTTDTFALVDGRQH
jgi:site-specific DNA-methyltransferase (adenine-specific)